MTLDRHRGKLIPEISFGGDSRLFVTDREGTFPLSTKKGPRERLPPVDYDDDDDDVNGDVRSFRSFDRKRMGDEQKRRYRQNKQSKYEREIQALSGTWSSGGGGSSLVRKVRRTQTLSRGDGKSLQVTSEAGSLRGSKRRGGKANATSNDFDLGSRRSLDIEKVRRSNKKLNKGEKTYFGRLGSDYNGSIANGDSPLLLWEAPTKNRKITEERLPGLVFIVTGSFLLILGVLRLFLSYWHEYYCSLWTGGLAILLGLLGLLHKGLYLSRRRNGAYIATGLLVCLATMASSFIILHVLVPLLSELALGEKAETAAANAEFTNLNKSLVSVDMDIREVVWISLSLDFSSLIMCLVNYFSLTATLIAISNHWDAEYGSTGECDHRGNPRLFNPLEQMSVGQATALIGCLTIVLQQSGQEHFWTLVWSGFAVMLAGFFSMCYGKRGGGKFLGVYSIIWEMIAMLACGAAIAFSTLALQDEVEVVEKGEKEMGDQYSLSVASLVAHGLFLCMMLINVVYIFGITFRLTRQMTGGFDCMPRPKAEPRIESTSL